jgi:hypothetical protein
LQGQTFFEFFSDIHIFVWGIKMRQQLFGAVILSASLATACSEDSNRTDRIVVLDSWWSLDYAKNICQSATLWYREDRELIKQLGCDAVTACPELMPRVNACANNPTPEVLQFFDQLATQFASKSQCAGVQITTYDGPSVTSSEASNTMAKPHRTLIVDYVPGAPKQAWGLVAKSETYMAGEGDPKEIVADICSIVTERGARFVK